MVTAPSIARYDGETFIDAPFRSYCAGIL